MLKFIGWGKRSPPEYITQHPAVQGQERSDCSSGMSSSSQWLRWEQSTEENQGLLLQNNLLQIHATFLDFLAHRTHACPPTSCLGLRLRRTRPVLASRATARRSSPGCALTFKREELRSMCPADRELNPNLSQG